MAAFQTWAPKVGLPCRQLAPVAVKWPLFLQGALCAYSQVRRGVGGGGACDRRSPICCNMGVRHSVFFRGGIGLTRVSPKTGTGRASPRWRDLVISGLGRLEHLEGIAYTWKMVYDMGVQDVRLSSLAPDDGSHCPSLDQWGNV